MAPETQDGTRGHDASIAYHARLLGDAHRLDAYDRAIRALVRPGDVVLDLGAGTGVLAMLAARAGARRVHAVESMPVAALAEELVRANGLADRVRVHRAVLQDLAPVEPVDLVVSDFMGRFVIDDGMLPAVAASASWLAPGARFCPSEVALCVAPVAIGHFAPLNVFRSLTCGLDLSSAEGPALRQCYGAELDESALLAPRAVLRRLRPPSVAGPIEGAARFELTSAGRLRGVAGWFEARLAPEVTLDTAPGPRTHWGQLLFPLPVTRVRAGDEIELSMRWPGVGLVDWRWEGVVQRGGRILARFGPGAEAPQAPIAAAVAPATTVDEWNERGAEAFQEGDYAAAALAFGRAIRATGPPDEARAGDLYENLGLAHAFAGNYRAAVGPFLRALDGRADAREQSARMLVDAYFRSDQPRAGERALRRYEASFGPHPSGWRRLGAADDRGS